MARLSWWGLSMYGGYYADIYVGEKHICLHAEKLKELKEQLAQYGINKLNTLRWDN